MLRNRIATCHARNAKAATAQVSTAQLRICALLVVLSSAPASAAQIDIKGPAGSVWFGENVAVLPNGNIVVTDRSATVGGVSGAGAVYLYSPDGVLISKLTGSQPYDSVGGDRGVVVVGDGNFVVLSPYWNNGGALQAGAATWVDGNTGLNGVVSKTNSLVGTKTGDQVGMTATTLANGNYVVDSMRWGNGGLKQAGAVTWAPGNSAIVGPVSSANSLIGHVAGEMVGSSGITPLKNGHYVVSSPGWCNGAATEAGAVTWGNGDHGISGYVSALNSLVGTHAVDSVGVSGVTALVQGNYVVSSYRWTNGTATQAGAATWGDGSKGVVGAISASNSLVGTHTNDSVSWSGVVALANGNYVVGSHPWNSAVGAATWANGNTGVSGAVSSSNSLVGMSQNDYVGALVIALSNGNYVVDSYGFYSGAGAVTWADGNVGLTGVISLKGSLLGGGATGVGGVAPLSNGDYVVSSYEWHAVGAATWGDGAKGIAGYVSDTNSLVGSAGSDFVSETGITALSNGNYVVSSEYWNDGAGATTLGIGTTGTSGTVSISNSLIGSAQDDVFYPRRHVTALANGNYVVSSYNWNSAGAEKVGAVTWGNGTTGVTGLVSSKNSLLGTTAGDKVGYQIDAFPDSNYAVTSPYWAGLGAVTLLNGNFRIVGSIQPWNSVIGVTIPASGIRLAYDPSRKQLVLGRGLENMITLFTMDQVFADSFD